jgi:hypothetical protein
MIDAQRLLPPDFLQDCDLLAQGLDVPLGGFEPPAQELGLARTGRAGRAASRGRSLLRGGGGHGAA